MNFRFCGNRPATECGTSTWLRERSAVRQGRHEQHREVECQGEECAGAQMIEYWGKPDATAARVRHGWIMTGDQAVRDAEGYIRYLGRDDDMVSGAGYRIGPAEVEESLLRHPAVCDVGVIPAPDEARGEVVKAVIVLAVGCHASEALTTELQQQVKTQLAAYKNPRIIEFVDELPKTTKGKINRKQLAAEARDA